MAPQGADELESHGLNQPILRADVAGMPLEWVDYKEAARLYTQGQSHDPGTQFHHRDHRAHGQPRQHAPRLRPAAEQPDAVPSRRLPVHVLRAALPGERTFA
jgi:hypothetical protein